MASADVHSWINLLSNCVMLCTKPETPEEFLAAMRFVKHSPVDALPDHTEFNDAFFKNTKQLWFAPIPRKPAARDSRQPLRRPDSCARLRHATRGVSRHEAHCDTRVLTLGERACRLRRDDREYQRRLDLRRRRGGRTLPRRPHVRLPRRSRSHVWTERRPLCRDCVAPRLVASDSFEHFGLIKVNIPRHTHVPQGRRAIERGT